MDSALKRLENQVTAWAAAQPAIRAVVVGGSTARRVNPGDEWADLDLEIYATDFDEFTASPAWLTQFGEVWTYLQLQEGDNPVFLTLYEGGEKVDFHFFHVDQLRRLVEAQELPPAYRRGYRVVVDKDGLAARLPAPLSTPVPVARPTAEEFAFQVNAFWYGVLYIARQIRRGNLWVVKFRDWTAKQSLLVMLEWHTQSTHNWEYETWHDGHFMSQWVDEPTWQELHQAFGAFDAQASWQALFATLALFRRLAVETAQNLGYSYPADLDRKVTAEIHSLHRGDGPQAGGEV